MEMGDVPIEHYPILIRYKDTDELVVVKEPEEVEDGRNLIVVKTSERPTAA